MAKVWIHHPGQKHLSQDDWKNPTALVYSLFCSAQTRSVLFLHSKYNRKQGLIWLVPEHKSAQSHCHCWSQSQCCYSGNHFPSSETLSICYVRTLPCWPSDKEGTSATSLCRNVGHGGVWKLISMQTESYQWKGFLAATCNVELQCLLVMAFFWQHCNTLTNL